MLTENWKIQESAKTKASGQAISKAEYNTHDWIDAHVPSTVMGILSTQEKYANLFIDDNYYKADKSIFDSSWWYRTTFEAEKPEAGIMWLLQLDGISYSANIWLNGKNIAQKDEVHGSFCRFEFDISQHIIDGTNTLALEVFRQQPGNFGLGFVDWNPRPLDESMGIWREVTVKKIDAVQMKNSVVRSKVNTETLEEAWLTVGTELKNISRKPITGNLKISTEGMSLVYPVSLSAGEKRTITLSPETQEALHLKNPKLWWCNGLGNANLYTMNFEFIQNGTIKASEKVTFGIREIETYFTEKGHRGFKLNGKEILIKGAGWTDDIFLRNTNESNEAQVKYVKDMGMNTIRFENIWGTSQNIYDLCDRYGILAMVGWSCQWEWENYLGKPCDEFGGIETEAEIDLIIKYMRDQILWLRNHPSIFVWLTGSDILPRPSLEKKYITLFEEIDNRPWLGAASNRISELSGPTGMKMNGPYEYVFPSYWYLDTLNGGAYGFNTETGPGCQIPVKESVTRFISPKNRWPLSSAWDAHCTTSDAAMNSMSLNNEVISALWGTPKNFDDFLLKSHMVNYEAIRAMFESFRVNRPNTTGIIQWMLNSAWPSLYWQLIDFYLIPTPAYYGVKKALEPIQLIYNYGDSSIVLSNETLIPAKGLKANITLYDLNSTPKFSRSVMVDTEPGKPIVIGKLPANKSTSLLKLELFNTKGILIADNVYWLSNKKEKFDWRNSNWYITPMKEYPDYTHFNLLKNIDLPVEYTTRKEAEETIITLNIRNTSETIALFVELKLLDENNEWIVPSLFSDNYVTLIAADQKKVDISVPTSITSERKAKISVSGCNVNLQIIEIKQ